MREQKQERNTHASTRAPHARKIATLTCTTQTRLHAAGAHAKTDAGRADQGKHSPRAPHGSYQKTLTTRKRHGAPPHYHRYRLPYSPTLTPSRSRSNGNKLFRSFDP